MNFTARKSLLAIAIASTLAGSALAQTAPSVTLYGRLDMAVESANDGSLTRTMLQNYASRFGIKGDRSFGSDLSGIFQIETAFSPEDGKARNQAGDTGFLANRNSFVGLKSNSMGTFLAGNYDTPLKSLDGGGLASTLWAEGDAMEVIIHGKGTKTATSNKDLFDNVHTRHKLPLAADPCAACAKGLTKWTLALPTSANTCNWSFTAYTCARTRCSPHCSWTASP